MQKFNVIEDNEDFIGKVSELKKYFIYNLGKIINDNDIGEEEKICNVGMIYDILEQLQKQSEYIVVKVKYNPMGAFYIADSLDS